MPEVTRFYGIIIKMFFKPKEHEPAHIHALYEEYMGVFDINTFEMTEGDLPNRAQKMVKEMQIYDTAYQVISTARGFSTARFV